MKFCNKHMKNLSEFPAEFYNTLTVSPAKDKTLVKITWCHGYNVQLYPMVRLQFQKSGECGTPLQCHYSQVQSD